MPRTANRRTDAEWEELISRFLASGLPQSVFCAQEGVSRFSFSPRYQRSPQFVGKRRKRTDKAASPKSNFRSVTQPRVLPGASSTVLIRIGDLVHIEATGEIALEAIVRLAAEARS